MQKKHVHGSLVFTANVPTYLPPKIMDEITMDDGERHYVLDNGHTTLVSKYNSLWHPKPGIVNHNKKYKGDNPDKRQQFLKP